jgi:phosphomannomutase
VAFASAYGQWLRTQSGSDRRLRVALGRDARTSGEALSDLVVSTLRFQGIDVLDLGLSTTPTVEMMVPWEGCDGGIILTASHNPGDWNALKLLNSKGEFLSAEDGAKILKAREEGNFIFSPVSELGLRIAVNDGIERHIQAILNLDLVDADAIRARGFSIAVDAVASTGGIAIPMLLKALGVARIEGLHCEPTGHFPHNPEPLRKHLDEICALVPETKCDLGIVVDPDVDRLVFVSEDGELFGEEYTLVAVADYLLQHHPGHVVSNLSSSRALRDIAERHNSTYSASAVGEVHVVAEMKAKGAVLGGEGNGGIILPELHYGRDALVGVALFLTYLAHRGGTCSELRATYPNYAMAKEKMDLDPSIDTDALLARVAVAHQELNPSTVDGVKIDFPDRWVHLRKSNTEPIIRIYTEAPTQAEAEALATDFAAKLSSL